MRQSSYSMFFLTTKNILMINFFIIKNDHLERLKLFCALVIHIFYTKIFSRVV